MCLNASSNPMAACAPVSTPKFITLALNGKGATVLIKAIMDLSPLRHDVLPRLTKSRHFFIYSI